MTVLTYIKVYVDDDCAKSIKYGTPTIYNPAIKKIQGEPKPGDIVEVYSLNGQFLGKGIWQAGHGLRVRIFTRDPREEITKELIANRIIESNNKRKKWGFKDVYRMVYGDSDFIPSLIVDRYKEIVVIQNSDPFLDSIQNYIANVILDLEEDIKTVYEKNDSRARQKSTLPIREGIIAGEEIYETIIEEHGIKYKIDVRAQKTGFYLDQRDNRLKIRSYIDSGDKVLDLYCYSGGFGMNAIMAGADSVTFVDISNNAIKLVKENLKLNEMEDKSTVVQMDAIDFMKKKINEGEKYDVVILDPPAFITSKKNKHKGIQGYFIVNRLAYKLAKRVVVTCSCSQFLELHEMISLVRAAAAESKKCFKIIEIGTQSKDHPILAGSPTTWYLKVLFTEII